MKRALLLILLVASLLRLWRLNEVPVSLFGDELDVGYQAYSILKTGKDYYGNRWPMHFHSLAEWRTPLYLYSSVPTVALFGISSWGVRLPAAIFGIAGVYLLYLFVKEVTEDERLSVVSAGLLAISPWHIQYSRAAFEVTEMLFFLLLGLWLFFKSLKTGKYLWISAASFALMPWVYSTAKLYTPMILAILGLLWCKDILKLPRKALIYAIIAFIVVGGPIAYSTVNGGGSQRFGYIGVFTNPVTETEVGVARLNDAHARGETGTGLAPTYLDRIFHNKFVFWTENILSNYFESYSTSFLFNEGDLNLRHSIHGMGQMYRIEALALIVGVILFFSRYKNKKFMIFIALWLLTVTIPAAITRDGGRHATRLFMMLPPLMFLTAYGITYGTKSLKSPWKYLALLIFFSVFAMNFIVYQHNYWVHNPRYSERWWHAGFEDSIKTIKEIEKDYDRVVISTANEPPWVFFAAWFEYNPDKWQKELPTDHKTYLKGFGDVSFIDKYYFATPSADGLYSWGQVIDDKTLYLATEKEVNVNLIAEPNRTPPDLKLIKSISYPSGEPAFYLFTGRHAEK